MVDHLHGEKVHWVDGHYVEEDALRVAERISEYWPNLRVQYLEYAASAGDPPFRVVEKCLDGHERTVMYAWKLDQQLFDRILMADTHKHDILKHLDDVNAKVKKAEQELANDKFAEAVELAKSIIKTSKSTYKVHREGELLVISDTKPAQPAVKPKVFVP